MSLCDFFKIRLHPSTLGGQHHADDCEFCVSADRAQGEIFSPRDSCICVCMYYHSEPRPCDDSSIETREIYLCARQKLDTRSLTCGAFTVKFVPRTLLVMVTRQARKRLEKQMSTVVVSSSSGAVVDSIRKCMYPRLPRQMLTNISIYMSADSLTFMDYCSKSETK